MSRRRKGDHVNGVILLDKPPGLSSNQALQRVRRLFNARKGGHTGNLDPFATGMLPICLGEASKTAAFMLDATKAYRATARLGEATATGDPEGPVVATGEVPDAQGVDWAGIVNPFIGEILQVPPMYSALKHQGRPLYEWARQGVTIERKPRPVTIHAISLVEWEPPLLTFEVVCSKGTYIRTLAEDLAAAAGTVAHLCALRRLWVEPFKEPGMVTPEMLESAAEAGELTRHLLPVDAGLAAWPVVPMSASDTEVFRHGNPVEGPQTPPENLVNGLALAHDDLGRPLGIAQWREGFWQPRKVFLLDAPG